MELIKEPDKILHKKLSNVADINSARELIEDMRKTMIKAKGVGLAANQVGQDLRIFVIDKELAQENDVPDAFINPELTELSAETDFMEEGCLSIPGYWHQIERSKKVWLKALDENGDKVKFRARGFLARVLQHEFDHLEGTLIKDRAQ